MHVTTKRDSPNVRRLSMIKLEANSFDEERILFAIFEIIDKGGTIKMVPHDTELPPMSCYFPGGT